MKEFISDTELPSNVLTFVSLSSPKVIIAWDGCQKCRSDCFYTVLLSQQSSCIHPNGILHVTKDKAQWEMTALPSSKSSISFVIQTLWPRTVCSAMDTQYRPAGRERYIIHAASQDSVSHTLKQALPISWLWPIPQLEMASVLLHISLLCIFQSLSTRTEFLYLNGNKNFLHTISHLKLMVFFLFQAAAEHKC